MSPKATVEAIANSTSARAIERVSAMLTPAILLFIVLPLVVYVWMNQRSEFAELRDDVSEISDVQSTQAAKVAVLENNQDRGRQDRILWQQQIQQQFKSLDEKFDAVNQKLTQISNSVSALAATLAERDRRADLP